MQYHELAEIIGQDAAAALCQECGGERIYVPRHEKKSTRVRELVRQLWLQNYPVKNIASMLELSPRRVYQVIKERNLLSN